MQLLTDNAPVFINGVRKTFKLYKAGSAENHRLSDDEELRSQLQRALNLPPEKKENQGNGVFRVRINEGEGYLVYKLGVDGPDSAAIFHYHWNYKLDLPLNVP